MRRAKLWQVGRRFLSSLASSYGSSQAAWNPWDARGWRAVADGSKKFHVDMFVLYVRLNILKYVGDDVLIMFYYTFFDCLDLCFSYYLCLLNQSFICTLELREHVIFWGIMSYVYPKHSKNNGANKCGSFSKPNPSDSIRPSPSLKSYGCVIRCGDYTAWDYRDINE